MRTPTPTADEPAGAFGFRPAYRAHLDGLRAVAVYLVVAFHARLGHVSGGFVGVDVFFVLSGYLVTRLLLDDLASRGRVRIRQFYARRARRVLPAALVTLVITAIAYARVATPVERIEALGGFRASFAYVANWYFVHQSTDYFAPNVATSPVLQFWSLAVEEQFYLLWPLALGALWVATKRAGSHQLWVVRSLIAIGAVISAAAALHVGAANLDRAYYGTDTRVYELLAGAVIALTPRLLNASGSTGRVARFGAGAAIAGIVLLASSAIRMSPITRGIWVTLSTGVLIVLLERAGGGLVRRTLALPPVAYLGRISYGVYLWHWPVVVLVLHDRDVAPLPLFAIACAAATALGALSYAVLEHPVRTARALDRLRGPVIAAGLSLSLLGAVVLAPAILEPSSTTVAASGRSKSGPRLLDWRRALNDIPTLRNCLKRPLARCTLTRGHGPRVLLLGDSNALMWIPAFKRIAKREAWTFVAVPHPACPWQRGLQDFFDHAHRALCRAYQTDWYDRVVPQFDPDIVLLAHQAFDDPAFPSSFFAPDGTGVIAGSPRVEPVLQGASGDSLRALRRPGRRIVILEPIPEPPNHFNPLSCLSTGRGVSQCSYELNRAPTPLERYYRRYAGSTNGTATKVVSIDTDRLVCPRSPTCDAVLDDVIVKRDVTHLTASFARSLAVPIERLLQRSGVLASPRAGPQRP